MLLKSMRADHTILPVCDWGPNLWFKVVLHFDTVSILNLLEYFVFSG